MESQHRFRILFLAHICPLLTCQEPVTNPDRPSAMITGPGSFHDLMVYPEFAEKNEIEGSVQLKVTITKPASCRKGTSSMV